jgi:hypothetical protein
MDVRPSKQKPQLTVKSSELIHDATKMLQHEPQIAASYTIKSAIKNDKKMANVDKKQDPAIPINRPKKKQEIKLKKGNNKIQEYINLL